MEYTKKGIPFFDREISWLSFNGRVLQEAADPSVPLLNRLQFLAIFSSNLDEFYTVRVASIRHLIRVAGKESQKQKLQKNLREINAKAVELQSRFGRIYREHILPELAQNNVFLREIDSLDEQERDTALGIFSEKLKDDLRIIPLSERMFLKNGHLYHFLRYKQDGDTAYAIVPFTYQKRFFILDTHRKGLHVLLLDDLLRLGLEHQYEEAECWSFKLNRDADLYLNEELADSVKEKVKKSLKKRQTGIPSRFLFDAATPPILIEKAINSFALDREDFVEGGRYHNYFDFWDFPEPESPGFTYPALKPLNYPPFEKASQMKAEVDHRDHLLHFPYQDYTYLLQFLDEAASDEEVTSIKMTLYRAAKNSAVFKALKKAAKNGKEVVLFNEVQARFDEENNMWIGEELEKAGARVLYSYEGLKVHSKIALVTRKREDKRSYQAVLASGNFNEKTAKVYSDLAMFTANQEIGKELDMVFGYLENPIGTLEFKHLLVARHNMRQRFEEMIDREIANAEQGLKAEIFCKMNSLQDRRMIEKLYEASQQGVQIRMLVRGICCLVPGKEGWSENIEIRSIVGRFLEHARVFVFHNLGKEEVFAGSADWMVRNLKRRIEVVFPVTEPGLKRQILKMMSLQWKDQPKARCINAAQDNQYCFSAKQSDADSQHGFYEWLKKKQKHDGAE